MTKWKCMECGNKWEADGAREDQECPACSAGAFMIKEDGKEPVLADYFGSFMKQMESAFQDMNSEEKKMLKKVFNNVSGNPYEETAFGKYIYEKGFTYYRLAKESGVSTTQIQKFVSGERQIKNMSLATGKKIADALGITMDDLLKLQ